MGTGCGGKRALGRGRRLGGHFANQLGYLRFERRALPDCMDTVMNRESTSNEAASAAAEVCARSSDGSALVGLLLPLAATTSFTELMQLFRTALDALEVIPKRACNRLFDGAGSGAIPVFGVLLLINPRLFILEARCFGVNAPAVPVCPIVA